MTKKIFHSIFTVAFVVLLASIGIATSFLYDYFNDSQVKQLKAELSLVADTVNEVGVEYFENFDSTVFRFTVVDTDGTVLYDTQAEPSEMENHADREEIEEALKETTAQIVETIHSVLEKTPPELAADIADRGIVLTGGGSLLRGLEELISSRTGINTMTAEDPMTAVAVGTGKYVEFLAGYRED